MASYVYNVSNQIKNVNIVNNYNNFHHHFCYYICHWWSLAFWMRAASRIRYEITSGNIGGAFAVKNMTGAIYVAGALDYETRRRVSW